MATKNPASKVDHQKSSYCLKKCFRDLVNRKKVNIDMCVLKLMLTYELQVDLVSLDPKLAEVIPYMVIQYIRNWPLWRKRTEYYYGRLNNREWFIKFKQYIILRLKFLIKNGYKDVLDSVNEEKAEQEKKLLSKINLLSKGTQTDPSTSQPSIAPFTISIQCSPKMMNSVIFSSTGDHILLWNHFEPPWTEITIAELVNWPYVGIDFISSELYFKRYNRTEFRRFVNFKNCKLDPVSTEFIEEVNILDPNVGRISYTLNRFFAYAQQYLRVLQKMDELSQSRLEAIAVILEEFLTDIEDIGVNSTMATNTSVLFNIGQCTFMRNKTSYRKVDTSHGIGYCETFIPKMEIHLHYFKASQDISTADVTFEYLNVLEKMVDEKMEGYNKQVPTLLFRCLFCDEDHAYTNHEDLMQHFEKIHGMESRASCPKCYSSISIMTLAKCRWKHICAKPSI